MNMFKPVNAKTPKQYFEMLTPERREILLAVEKIILRAAPSLRPNFLYNMLGYGSFKYKNNKGVLLDWPTIAMASQKNYVSVYICSIVDGKYLAETHAKELGKVSVGKSCIRFKKLEDLNLKAFEKVIRLAAKKPGLTSLGKDR